MATPKKSRNDDDELFPDTGPKRSPTKKIEKPQKAEKKVEKAEKAEKKPAVEKAPEKVEKAPERPKTGKIVRPAPEPAAPAGMPGGVKAMIAAIVLASAGGGAAVVGLGFLGGDDASRPRAVAVTAKGTPQQPTPAKVTLQPSPSATPEKATPVATPAVAPATKKPEPAAPAAVQPVPGSHRGTKSREELARRSANHASISQILELYEAVRKPNFGVDGAQLFEDYQAKQKREQELLEQVRALGGPGIEALKDTLLNIDDDGFRIFLAKALGGMNTPESYRAAAEVLSQVQDIAVQTTLVRFLPETQESAQVVAGAFAGEQNPNVRSMLLREYARRLGDGDMSDDPMGPRPTAMLDRDQGRELFRKAALEDGDPLVRAEAVSIIGRRGDARDMDLMAQIAQKEPNLQIRQAAIVAYATTGNQTALPMLENLARQDESLEIRASAVLGIARVGNERSIAILEQIAATDPREEIRTRAAGFAQGLRAKIASEHEERNGPQRIDPETPYNPSTPMPQPNDPPPPEPPTRD